MIDCKSGWDVVQKIQTDFDVQLHYGLDSKVPAVSTYEIEFSGTSLTLRNVRRFQITLVEDDIREKTEYSDRCSFEIFDLVGTNQLLCEGFTDIQALMSEASSFTQAKWQDLFTVLTPLAIKGSVGHSSKSSGFELVHQAGQNEKFESESGYCLYLEEGIFTFEVDSRIDSYTLDEKEFDQKVLNKSEISQLTSALGLAGLQDIFRKILDDMDWPLIQHVLSGED